MKKIFAFLIGLMALAAQGQEYKVAEFAMDVTDLTARTQSRVDRNGRKCAVLKIYVPDKIVEVRGSTIGDVVSSGMEKLVYVPHDTKRVEFIFEGHYPLNLVFDDFGYPTACEQMVYRVKLVEVAVGAQAVAQTQTAQTAVAKVETQKRFKVKYFEENSLVEGIKPEYNRHDYDGNPCAMLMINDVDEITKTEGYVIGNVEKKGFNQQCIFLSPEAKQVRLHFKNHKPLIINFKEYGISNLSWGKVYIVDLVEDNQHQVINNAINTDIKNKILDLVETYRRCFVDKNLEGLKEIFQSTNIIITGNKILSYDSATKSPKIFTQNEYSSINQFLNMREGLFKRYDKIEMVIDNITISKSATNTNIYGVNFKQHFITRAYSDDGWVFFMVDMTNPEKPQIHANTWQPIDTEDEIFTLDDFFIP